MICFCLNNLRSESWMDAEYGNWSFEGMTLLWRCCEIENFSGQEECTFWEIVHTVVLNIFAGQWSGYNSRLCAGRPLGFVFNWRNYERELVERIFCGDGDFDNFSGQAKYVFILRIVQTVVLKNCRTCAAIACYVRKLDHWLQEERRYLIMRS